MTNGIWQIEDSADLRDVAIFSDAHAMTQVSLATLWTRLVAGTARIKDAFCTETRCYALLEPAPRRALAASDRRIGCLERFLLGEQQKVVAEDLRVARSTVASDLGECLDAMGIGRRTSRVPVLLVMAVRASHGDSRVPGGRISRLTYEGNTYSVISAHRPHLAHVSRLSRAECHVAQLLIDGKTRGEIAHLRRTSVRTIANQLAAAFQKLGVSGRSELLHYAVHIPSERASRPLARAQGSAAPVAQAWSAERGL